MSNSDASCSPDGESGEGNRCGVRFYDSVVMIATLQPLLSNCSSDVSNLCDFFLGGESHATCLIGSAALIVRVARIVSIIERKIFAPSVLPTCASEARSGCGIKQKTFISRLKISPRFVIEHCMFAV